MLILRIAAIALAIGLSLPAKAEDRTLSLYFTHTKESLTVTYKRNGRYDRQALAQVNRLLRDWRRNEETQMDPHLLDVLWQVVRATGARQAVHVVSAYRSPTTNAMLRSRSSAVAKTSQHMQGRAIDFHLPGVPVSRIREVGLKMQAGGVGFYPTSNTPFIHLDTGTVRHWPRMTRQQLVNVFPDGKTVHIPSDGKPLPGFQVALAEAKRRGANIDGARVQMASVSDSEIGGSGGRRRGFFARLFGGAEEAEDMADAGIMVAEAPEAPQAPAAAPVVVAAAPPPVVASAPPPVPVPAPELPAAVAAPTVIASLTATDIPFALPTPGAPPPMPRGKPAADAAAPELPMPSVVASLAELPRQRPADMPADMPFAPAQSPELASAPETTPELTIASLLEGDASAAPRAAPAPIEALLPVSANAYAEPKLRPLPPVSALAALPAPAAAAEPAPTRASRPVATPARLGGQLAQPRPAREGVFGASEGLSSGFSRAEGFAPSADGFSGPAVVPLGTMSRDQSKGSGARLAAR